MKAEVILNGAARAVEFDPAGASVSRPEEGVYSVLWNGRVYEARVEGAAVVVNGVRFEIEVRDPRRWSRSGGAAGLDGRQHLVAPMPGRVVRVLAAPGDRVQAGQGILVVEAMKMQNEMKAARAGTVASISAREGAPVAQGEVLAVIE